MGLDIHIDQANENLLTAYVCALVCLKTPTRSFTTTDEHTQTSGRACIPSSMHTRTNIQTRAQITPTPQSPILCPAAHQTICTQTSLWWSIHLSDCLCAQFSLTCHLCQMRTVSQWPTSNLLMRPNKVTPVKQSDGNTSSQKLGSVCVELPMLIKILSWMQIGK